MNLHNSSPENINSSAGIPEPMDAWPMESHAIPILRLGKRCAGTGLFDSKPILVPNALPGETALCRIIQDRYRQTGRLTGILAPSLNRITPGCRQTLFCPGCQLRCLAYSAQQEELVRRVTQALKRQLNLTPTVTFIPHPAPEHYRTRTAARLLHANNRILLTMKPRPGFDQIVNLTRCENHHPELNAVLQFIGRRLNHLAPPQMETLCQRIWQVTVELSADGQHRVSWTAHASLRETDPLLNLLSDRPDLSVHLIVAPPPSDHRARRQPRLIQGIPEITVPMNGLRFFARPGAWTPVSWGTAELLENLLASWLQGFSGGEILEVGCGIGLTALHLAARGYPVTGIDGERPAVISAEANSDVFPAARVNWIAAQAVHALRKLMRQPGGRDILIFHGMRKPFGKRVWELTGGFKPRVILLVSPGIHAFVSDCADLAALGWHLQKLAVLDQIPHTTRVTAAGLFQKL